MKLNFEWPPVIAKRQVINEILGDESPCPCGDGGLRYTGGDGDFEGG